MIAICWASGLGYSGLLHNRTESKIPSGVAPAIGVGYRYSHNNFIFQTGLEGQYAWMTCVMPLEIYQQRMVDSDINHEPFMMTAAISDRKEVYQTANVQLPLYVGYEKGYFYALAGVTAGLNVYGTASSKGTLDTRAEYERLIGVMEEMPNHGLTRIDVNSGSKTFHTNINVMAHVEIGGRLDKFYQKTGFRAKRHTHRLYCLRRLRGPECASEYIGRRTDRIGFYGGRECNGDAASDQYPDARQTHQSIGSGYQIYGTV